MSKQIKQRQDALAILNSSNKWDMLIIGGGITGVGIAREAARRKLNVLLIEQKDFAWGTSSRSSKMVHGGLRYIASGDIKTTMHSVHERERMLNEAPGLVQEMHYVMPHYKGKFPPPWLFNNLLMVYDKFAGKRYRQYFKRAAFLNQNTGIKEDDFLGASQFSDAVTDDSRLVMRVLEEAEHAGAHAINYLKAEELIKNEHGLVIGAVLKDNASLIPKQHNKTYQVYADVVVNATGAWADDLRQQATGQSDASFHKQIRPSRGSHLVVSQKRLPVDRSYTLRHPEDKRALFIFPWESRTVIGTTDLDHPPLDDSEVGITSAEVDYLLAAANDVFANANITKDDIISTWAGVRPLISNSGDGKRVSPSKEKREHSVWLDNHLITVSGGKLTTFRLIALDVLKAYQKLRHQALPNPSDDRVFTAVAQHNDKHSALPSQLLNRLQGFYGRKLDELLDLAKPDELNYVENTNTLWAELRYAAHAEQVVHLDDLLLRRTRLGLLLKHGGLYDPLTERIKQICQQELGWDEEYWQQERQRYQSLWQQYYHLPAA